MSRARDAAASDSREALIFLHIPKTAGTTLNRILETQYSPRRIFTIDARLHASTERFQHLPEARRRRLQVVRGHLLFGLHEFLPQGATYITLLREPVARVLSAYQFVLRRPLNPLHGKLKREKLTVEDCLRLFPLRQNSQCRFIAGVGEQPIDDQRLLDLARENLAQSFRVVGLVERFAESLMLIAATFGWKLSYYENQRVSKTPLQIEPRVLEKIREHNRLDLALYEFGRELFEENVRRNSVAVGEKLAAQNQLPKPAPLKAFCNSTFSSGRFLLNKFLSAI